MQLGGQLPSHMRVGRANMPGPVYGFYKVISLGCVSSLADAAVVVPVNYDFRLMAVGICGNLATSSTNLTLSYSSDAAISADVEEVFSSLTASATAYGFITPDATTAIDSVYLDGERDYVASTWGYVSIYHGNGAIKESDSLSVYLVVAPVSHLNEDPADD